MTIGATAEKFSLLNYLAEAYGDPRNGLRNSWDGKTQLELTQEAVYTIIDNVGEDALASMPKEQQILLLSSMLREFFKDFSPSQFYGPNASFEAFGQAQDVLNAILAEVWQSQVSS